MSRILAGPFAWQVPADLGADMIKVEHPERNAAYFCAANRDKRSIRAEADQD